MSWKVEGSNPAAAKNGKSRFPATLARINSRPHPTFMRSNKSRSRSDHHDFLMKRRGSMLCNDGGDDDDVGDNDDDGDDDDDDDDDDGEGRRT